MRHESKWSPDFKAAVIADLLDLIGSDPLSPNNAARVHRNWERLDAFEAAALRLHGGPYSRTDGALQDARNAYREIDRGALPLTPSVERWLLTWTDDTLAAVDWS